MTVWSFCPEQIQKKLKTINIKNKGDRSDLLEYKENWIKWIYKFSGCEFKNQWAISNGIHDAIVQQIAYKAPFIDNFYIFINDYKFYRTLLDPYGYKFLSRVNIDTIKPNSYIIVSQPNHEGKITDWFEHLKQKCKETNSKIFLDCAFYGTTFDTLDTSDSVFDAVAFSLSKNFLLAGWRAGIVFGDQLAPSLTIPIDHHFDYNYFNIAAAECAKVILPNFKATFITEFAKPMQKQYCITNNLIPADIWMWAFTKNNQKICITPFIKDKIQQDLNLIYD